MSNQPIKKDYTAEDYRHKSKMLMTGGAAFFGGIILYLSVVNNTPKPNQEWLFNGLKLLGVTTSTFGFCIYRDAKKMCK